MSARARLSTAKRWVIKLGSALLTQEGRGLDRPSIQEWVDQIATLRSDGTQVVIVSSGSVVEGMSRLGWNRRPQALNELQAAAAVGQMGIARVYEQCFHSHAIHTAQILLTHDDVSDRARYLNARSTLRQLLSLGVVPVVNENDTISTEAIKLGDNDTLAGLVCNLVEADVFIILTDQQGLFSADPRENAQAQLISHGQAGDPNLDKMAGEGGEFGTGGMRTKLKAAALAARSGTATVIASGLEPKVLLRLARAEPLGTLLEPSSVPLAARKQWLAGQFKMRGQLRLDLGAAKVLRTSGKSLLCVGVRDVEGLFDRGELVSCLDPDGHEVARGLVNYNAEETRQIMGHPSGAIMQLLGYVDELELIHRDNLVLTGD
jgi:glutamate 5-kinase